MLHMIKQKQIKKKKLPNDESTSWHIVDDIHMKKEKNTQKLDANPKSQMHWYLCATKIMWQWY